LTSALDGGERSASRSGRFTPRERTPSTHWIGGWVGGCLDLKGRKTDRGENCMMMNFTQGLRQGCSLSPALFNIYIDDVIKRWKPTISPGIKLQGNIYLNSLLYADDLTIIQSNEDDLQRSIFYLSKLCQDYNLKISKNKTKTMAFKGKRNVRSKIVLENTTLGQVQQFNYLKPHLYKREM
jgi:hypothetical protein